MDSIKNIILLRFKRRFIILLMFINHNFTLFGETMKKYNEIFVSILSHSQQVLALAIFMTGLLGDGPPF